MSFHVIMEKEKKSRPVFSNSRTAPDCANCLAFDANSAPVTTEYVHKAYFIIRVKGQIKHSAPLWRSFFFRGKYPHLTLKHIYFPFSPSHPTHPPTHLTSDNWGPPVPQPIDSSALNLNLGATETTIKEALSLSKTDCSPNNTCSLSLISSIHRMNHLSSAVLDFLTIQFMWNVCISCV